MENKDTKESKNKINNREQKRTEIVPLLLLGGALAAAIFTFMNKANKKNPQFPTLKKPLNCKSNNAGQSERLLSLIQTPSPSADSDRRSSRYMPRRVYFRKTKTCIPETLLACKNQEIVSDDSKAESSVKENINKEDHVQDTPFLEVIEVTREKVELSEVTYLEKMIQEEEKRDEDAEDEDEDNKNNNGKEEDDSEGTSDSSRKSNEEEQVLELNNQPQHVRNSQETVEENEVCEEKMEETVIMRMVHNQNAPSMIISKSRFRMCSILAVSLLLPMILHRLFLTYYLKPDSPFLSTS